RATAAVRTRPLSPPRPTEVARSAEGRAYSRSPVMSDRSGHDRRTRPDFVGDVPTGRTLRRWVLLDADHRHGSGDGVAVVAREDVGLAAARARGSHDDPVAGRN